MSNITVTIVGGEAVRAKIKKLGESLYDMRGEFEDAGRDMAGYYGNEVFNSQGGVFGERWAPLATGTLRSKTMGLGGMSAGASPAQPLVRSGKMRDSFKFEASKASVRVYNDVTSDRGDNYFQFHQLGTSHIPQRMMIGLNKALEKKIAERVRAGIERKLRSV